MKKKFLLIGTLLILTVVVAFSISKFFSTSELSNTKVSGKYFGNQVWRGEVNITGDVEIFGNLTIKKGATIRFEVGDDQKSGDEVPADGYNTNDPTRLLSYSKAHSGIFVLRKLVTEGTENNPITFTSAAQYPQYADWESIVFRGDGSVIQNTIVEYSRNGLNPIGNQPHSVIRDSIIRHTFWGAVSSGYSPILVLHNHLYDCGHEGVDIQYGNQIVRDNLIEDCHAGIVILGGSPVVENNTVKGCGDGIHVDTAANPKLSNNTIVLANESKNHKYTYQSFSYNLLGEPDE